ncbi:MAG: MraY family glycosyltransferase [Chthoniobacteraceae bacterium]
MIYSFLFLAFGFFVSVLCTPWMIRLSQSGIGLDHANEPRKKHGAPIPRLGGVPLMLAMSLGLVLILAVRGESSAHWFAVLLGSALMYGLGLWDDLRPLGARIKLLGQVATACVVFGLGLNIEKFSYPGTSGVIELGGWSLPATVFWLIAIPNIVNLIDGFDGLAGGLGLCMAVTLGIVALHSEQVAVACYAFTMAGALLGFLVFNFPPARIYLGDGGAYLIGFTIAALSLTSSNKGSVAAVLFVTLVALGVPILDTTFALLRRGLRGYPLFRADDEHFHHRLERLGFSKRRILLGLYGLCLVLSLVGLSIIWSQGRTLPIGICLLFILVLFILRYFHLVNTWGDFRQRFERVLGHRREVQYALLQAQVLELELERCPGPEEFWLLFHLTLRRVGFLDADDDEDSSQLDVHSPGSTSLTLHVPTHKGSHREWRRMAECFRPIYVKALQKWPQ